MNVQLLLGAMKVQLLFSAAKAKGEGPVGFSKVLHQISQTITDWGNEILIIVGIVLIAYGGIALFKAVKSLGGQQGSGSGMEWAKAILAIIIGIVLCATKINEIRNNEAIDSSTLKHALNGEG